MKKYHYNKYAFHKFLDLFAFSRSSVFFYFCYRASAFSTAMLVSDIDRAILSVSLSVTLLYCIEMALHIITLSSAYNSPTAIVLVFQY